MSELIKKAPGYKRKDQIKKATLNIFYSQGMNKFSTKNLAQHVHISQGAIFKHFHSKNDIILEIMEDVKNDLLKPLQKIVWENIKPDKKLKEFMCYHLNYFKENKGITILILDESTYRNDQFLKRRLREFFSLIKQYFGKIIHDGIANKMWDCSVSVDSLSALYLGVSLTISIELYLNPNVFTHKEFCVHMLTMIKRSMVNSHY